MKTARTLWTLPLLGMLAMPALAGDDRHDGYREDRIERRMDRQHWRIEQGIQSGELTRVEAKRLSMQQRQIASLVHRFSRDGYLDRQERRALNRKLDKASDRIYRLKHNDREAKWVRPPRHDHYERPADGSWWVTLAVRDLL